LYFTKFAAWQKSSRLYSFGAFLWLWKDSMENIGLDTVFMISIAGALSGVFAKWWKIDRFF
jgi:hypothetical protein